MDKPFKYKTKVIDATYDVYLFHHGHTDDDENWQVIPNASKVVVEWFLDRDIHDVNINIERHMGDLKRVTCYLKHKKTIRILEPNLLFE